MPIDAIALAAATPVLVVPRSSSHESVGEKIEKCPAFASYELM